MNFQINIYGAPWSSNAAIDAIALINQVKKEEHIIKRVFFFFDGVYQGLNSQSPSSDEFDLVGAWQTIAEQKTELLLCIAASANRGVLSDEEAKRYDHPTSTLAPFFEVTGLGQWASGFHDVDRIITFK